MQLPTVEEKRLKTSKMNFFSFWHAQSITLQIGVIRSTDVGQLGLAVCALLAINVGQQCCKTGWIVYGPFDPIHT